MAQLQKLCKYSLRAGKFLINTATSSLSMVDYDGSLPDKPVFKLSRLPWHSSSLKLEIQTLCRLSVLSRQQGTFTFFEKIKRKFLKSHKKKSPLEFIGE